MYDKLLIGVFPCNRIFNTFNYFHVILTGSCISCPLGNPRVFRYFFSHGLFNFAVNGVFAKHSIVLLQLQTIGSILSVFLCNIARCTRHACSFVLGALQYNLQPVTFALLSHYSTVLRIIII